MAYACHVNFNAKVKRSLLKCANVAMDRSWTYCAFSCATYCILCAVYLLFGVNSRKQWKKAATKCLPIAFLVVLTVTGALSHLNNDDWKAEKDRSHPNFQLLLLGLLFSGFGDVLLVYHSILGVVSFAVAQCIYTALFGLSANKLVEVQQSLFGLSSGLLVFLLSLSILLIFTWQFNVVLKSGDHGMRQRFLGFVMPMALVYFALISLMLWSALLQLQHRMDLVGVLGAIGGLLFYVSDVLIAAGAIWRFRILLHGRILVMVTYYSAQLLITFSTLTI